MLLQKAIIHFQERLKEAQVDNPSLDVRLLIAYALRCDRAALIATPERALTIEELSTIDLLINRRCAREPVGRILGQREFWGLPIRLNDKTLEPRPDSETLVNAAFDGMHDRYYEVENCRRSQGAFDIVDVGTGSGCLLFALLSEWKEATGTGIDKSRGAVEQATANAERLGFSDRAKFKTGNFLYGLTKRFDVVISNPPYIPTSDIETLDPEVRLFDPKLALDGGPDGLTAYNQIIPMIPHVLNPNGGAFLEVGIKQAATVAEMMRNAGLDKVSIKRDTNGIERVVSGFLT